MHQQMVTLNPLGERGEQLHTPIKWMDLHPECKPPCLASVSGNYIQNAKPGNFGGVIQSMLDANRDEVAIDGFFSKQLVNWKEGHENWLALPVTR